MTSMTLVEFLLARIAEDEEGAQRASTGKHWTWTAEGGELVSDHLDEHGLCECIIDTEGANPPGPGGSDTAQHIARHDPARVLAECEAKRRVIELHQAWPVLVECPAWPGLVGHLGGAAADLSRQRTWQTEQEYRDRFGSEPPTAPMLKALALPYASHPDYREEWRPTA